MSIRSCFLKSFNFFDESETLIYEGGGGLIAVSKDFKWVINASDNTLNPTLFDIKGGGKTSISSGGHKKKITSLSSSFYDNVFASGDESGFLRLWNCDTFDSIGGLQVFDSSSIDAITLICLDLGHLMSLKPTKFVPPLDGYKYFLLNPNSGAKRRCFSRLSGRRFCRGVLVVGQVGR